MPFDFPASPANGQQFTPPSGSPTYTFNGTGWTMGEGVHKIFVGDVPPVNPVPGQLWWESDSGDLYVYYYDGNSSQWVQINVGMALLAGYLPLTGGTLSGPLSVATANPGVLLNRPDAASESYLAGQVAGIGRWAVVPGNNAAEGGANAGSDFAIRRYSDAGALLGAGLTINRATGAVAFAGNVVTKLASPYFTLDKTASAQSSTIQGTLNGVQRWNIELGDELPEGGSNAGSRFKINRYNDAGAYLGSPLYIDRDTGFVNIQNGALFSQVSSNVFALDHYSEGQWAATVRINSASTGITYSTNTGYYMRVGSLVFVTVDLALTNKGALVGNVDITGLPWNPVGGITPVTVGYNSGLAGINGQILGYCGNSSLVMFVQTATGSGPLTNAHLTNATRIVLAGTYMVF